MTETYRELMQLLHRAALLSDRVGERRFLAKAGVGRAMFLVLRTIAEAGERGPISQQSIARRLSLTKGAVSRHVATAERNGWLTIEASPVSRRENALVLTETGREVIARGRAVQREYEAVSDQAFDEDDVAAAVRTLRVMCELLDKEDQS
ncbi:MarR family transcriptional regulator [Actinomadura barringtoniae]|uniref:MarR family transcriptional regulator n=1 Tax=Actinomadura barringtoniae TaxID=1427535 RepID=A0A939PPU4_9ACTN|nr:MarR family transcriptional regulator [Actinomadura barringtoniae]MBO2453004.1 MarR family transcriptional regulator [Actinomadura barringtoniae]